MSSISRNQIKQEQDAIAKFELTNGAHYIDTISRAVEQMVRGIPPQYRLEALDYLNAMTPRNCPATSYNLRLALAKFIEWL